MAACPGRPLPLASCRADAVAPHPGGAHPDKVRRHLTDHTGRWKPISADGITLFNLEKVGVTRYRYRGAIPSPWAET